MEILQNTNYKRNAVFAGIVVIALIFLLALIVERQIKKDQVRQMLSDQEKAKKQQEMLNAIQRANKNAAPVSGEEVKKDQESMLKAIEETNKNQKPVPLEQQANQQKAMLDAIKAANNK